MGRCYSELFTHGLAPELLHDTLGADRLFARGFRNRLILHAFDKVTRAARKAALFEGALPARDGWRNNPRPPLLTPLAHVGNIQKRTVGYRLDPLPLAARPAVHGGGYLHIARAEMVLSIDHRPLIIGLQRAAGEPGLIPRQPQRGVHHMEIIIQQGKAQIVWPDTVGPMLVHPQRCRTGELRFKLPIERREAAVKADHQGEFLLCGEVNEPLGVAL